MTKVAIIGGGLAGTACAYVLKHFGAEPVIYEAGETLSNGASGNPAGLYNPRIFAERTAESDYFAAAFAQLVRVFHFFQDIDWHRCGSLHLITDQKRRMRFLKTVQNWGWDFDHMRILNADQASQVAGVELRHEALFFPDAGVVSPRKLCAAYAGDVEVRLNTDVESVKDLDADAVILACGMGLTGFKETVNLPVSGVRGQVTQVKGTDQSQALKCNLCYGGYFSPAIRGVHTVGATFQRWLDHDDVIGEDNEYNIEKLADIAPDMAQGLEVVDERAAIRTASADYFPIVGAVPGHDSLYVSAAHGSHGIVSSIAAAHLLADMIMDKPRSLAQRTIERLQPARFLV